MTCLCGTRFSASYLTGDDIPEVYLPSRHLMTLLQIGSMPKDLTMKNTELFATQVMPHVQDMWSEYEDHWWPKPITQNVQVGD